MIDRSFFLVRTNPALTGNIKLVVSSDYKLFLESFAINKTLGQQRLQHVEIKKEEYWKEVIPYFFQDIESKTVFDVKFDNDTSEVYDDYRHQFDDTYHSGAFFTEDTYYNEEYEYLAPLYIKNNALPKNFIILRVDGSGSLNQDSDASNFRSQIIDNWKFVSMYDLTENTDLGVWIKRNFISDEDYPKFPLFVNHGDDLSEISGIDTINGGWVKKYLSLKDVQSKNTPIFKTEEYFTQLWQDNNLVYPHIINMKFLFDDTPATPTSLRKWSINRYIGFYVDDKPTVKTVSPYQASELSKVTEETLKDLSAIEVSEIPFLKDNKFVREAKGRLYSFNPIKKGWKDTLTYWVEWKGKFYRIERIENPDKDVFKLDGIIGDFIYRVVSDIIIEHKLKITKTTTSTIVQRIVDGELMSDENNEFFTTNTIDDKTLSQFKKILINELTTGKHKIVVNSQKINNTLGTNIIQSVNPLFTSYQRLFDTVLVDGIPTLLFRINTLSFSNDFTIPNFNNADLFLINIDNNYHVVKQYPNTNPNLKGKYYIQTDWSINVNDRDIVSWINNGYINKNPAYYKRVNIESTKSDSIPPYFDILRINFTDIKDFDFDRVETDYANFEYEKKFELNNSLEPKLYATEYRDIIVKVRSLIGTNDRARRIPITDLNNRPYTIRDQIGEINPFTQKPYEDFELFRREYDSSWSLFSGTIDGTNWGGVTDRQVSLKRRYYREEQYVWRVDDNLKTYEFDFKSNSDPANLEDVLTWGLDGKGEISDAKIKSSLIKSKQDPNKSVDTNYIPVSSEYISSDELWEINQNDLTEIWRKNQSICKWGFLNSQGLHDYPYRLNYSLDMAGIFNREPSIFTGNNFPIRSNLDLDYFYRFGLNNAKDYKFYSLHLKEPFFDLSKYVSTDYDYFEYIFKSDQETIDGLELTTKYSTFISANEFNDPYTIFRGVKYTIFDVDKIKFSDEESNSTLIDDIITKVNINYEDYKFAIVFGRKLNGSGNNNSGVDIYVNDYWKNVLIHLYVDTEETIQISQLTDGTSGTAINAETCEIDVWYNDNIEREEVSPIKWDNTGFKVNSSVVSRPRDFMLQTFLFNLNNFNYNPPEGKDDTKYIHIYNDGTISNPMTYETTDVIIKYKLPEETIIKQNAFSVNPINVDIDINNTFKNRIVLDDDTDSPTNNVNFTSDGFRVGSLLDVNSYNYYPIAKEIVDGKDNRQTWELDNDLDPSVFRYSGPYVPIFRTVPLFRPMGYIELTKLTNGVPSIKESGNWKFYDPSSSTESPNVVNFGSINELIFSKCNTESNILKIDSGNGKSIYPMVDEYGYEFDSRYLFSSNWEPGFYYQSRKVEVESNVYPGIAGYTVLYDGIKDYLRIQDAPKFNLERHYTDNLNYENFILNEPEGERSFFRQTIIGVPSSDIKSINVKLLANQDYTLTLDFFNKVGSATALNVWIELINDPQDVNQSSTKYILAANYQTITPNGTSTTNSFKTYKYTPTLTYSGNNLLSYNGSSGSNLENYYVYGNIINAKINFKLVNGTGTIDIYPMKLQLSSVVDNFLDINVGATNGTGGIIYENDLIGTWGGYIKKDTEVGDVHTFPFRLIGREKYSTFPTLVSNIKSSSAIIGGITKTTSDLLSRGFIVDAGSNGTYLTNKTGPYLRISHTEPFSFEPERWTNILDGNSIVYVGQTINLGDSNLNPEWTLKWFTNIKSPKTYINTIKLHAFEPEINRRKNGLFKNISQRVKLPFIPGVINTKIKQKYFFEPKPFIPPQSNILQLLEKERQLKEQLRRDPFFKRPSDIKALTDLEAKIAAENAKNKLLTNPTHIQPLGKVLFVPGLNFQPIPIPSPQQLISNIHESLINSKSINETIEFNIVPDNGDKISVIVNSRHPDDNSALDMTQIIGLINNVITPNYEAIEVDTSSPIFGNIFKGNFKSFKIISRNPGSYYNFIIEIKSSHLSTVGIPVIANIESTISEKHNKTSLKNADIRTTGYMADITIEFWVRIDGWTKDYETILYKGEDTSDDPWTNNTFNNFTFIIGKNGKDDKLAFRTCHRKLNGQYEKHNLISTTDISDGAWHHVACVVDTFTSLKSIYIDGSLDAKINDFLSESYTKPSEKELVALFIENRKRFYPKSENISKFPDFQTLASKIRNDLQDNKTLYWLDSIRGYRELDYWDKQLQEKELGITIDDAYREFQDNFTSLDYYLNVDINNSWSLLIGTDSTIALGRRTFKGGLDELRYWNYVRSGEQINTNYTFILRPESYLDPLKSLVAYYRFDEGKGSSTLKDLMGGKMIADMSRWARIKTSFSNDGFKENEKDEVAYFHFESAYFPASDIQVNVDSLNWIVSDANIVGFSDERYVSTPPPPSTKESIVIEQKPTFKKNEFMLAKKSKPVTNLQTLVLNTKLPTAQYHSQTWLQKVIEQGKTSAFSAVQYIGNVKIVEPTKIIQTIAKAPSKFADVIKSLFNKRRK